MHTDTECIINNNADSPSVAVSVLVFTTKKNILRIALIKCPESPYPDKWSLPCTSIRVSETGDESALRCLKDSTGITDVSLEQLYTFSDVNRNPNLRTIMISYIAMVSENTVSYHRGIGENAATLFDIVRSGDGFYLQADTDDGVIKLRDRDLLYDHAQMIGTALDRMAGKIDYTEIGFRFLNNTERFTLTELRLIYDAVKGTNSDVGNFRRFIKNRYISTGKVVNNLDDRMEMEHAGRPASTFRYIADKKKE